MEGLLGLLVLLWLPCAFFARNAAHDKGHDGISWFFGGLIFGPLAMLAVAGLSDRRLRRYLRLAAEHQGADVGEANLTDRVLGIKRKRVKA